MIKLWKDGTNSIGKFYILMLCILIVGPLQVIISHSFIPSEHVIRFANWSALGFAIFFISLIFYIRKKASIKLFFPHTGFKRVLVILYMPAFLYGFSWINIAIAAPQLITIIFGEDRFEEGLAIKQRENSARACDFRLIPHNTDFWFFHYCIPSSEFTSLPDGEFKVQLLTKNSSLGVHYKEINSLR